MPSSVTARNAWAALVLAATSAAASCTVFDDRVVADVASATGAGGAPGGGGGALADGGAGSTTGGAGGTAGVGGGEPHVGYLSLNRAVRLCARVFDCDGVGASIRASLAIPVDEPPTFSYCAHWLAGPLPVGREATAGQVQMLEAMADAPDCEATRRAAYIEKLAEDDPLCPVASGRECSAAEGGVVDCGRKRVERCDNALLGLGSSCVEVSGTAACVMERCDELTGTCAGELNLRYCTGIGSYWQIAGCGERGLVCQGLTFDCRDKAAVDQSCNTTDQVSCDGQVVEVCADTFGAAPIPIAPQVKSPFDCAKIEGGASCQTEPAWHCQPVEHDCVLTDADSCSDGSIEVCVGGERVSVDCGAGLVCIPESPARCGSPG